MKKQQQEPRLKTRAQAAAYLGMSVATFAKYVQPTLPIVQKADDAPVDPLWDTKDLDDWITGRKVTPEGLKVTA